MDFITSKEMYDQALKLFNVEVRKTGRGYSVFVTDENGNPVRHPVRMRDFEGKPKFYLSEDQTLAQHHSRHLNLDQTGISTSVLKSLVLKELMRQVGSSFNHSEYQTKAKQQLKFKRKQGNRFRK